MVDSTDVWSRTAIDLHTALLLQPSSRPASIVIKVECFLLDVLLLFPLLRVDNIFRNKKKPAKYSCTYTIHGASFFKMSDKAIRKTGSIHRSSKRCLYSKTNRPAVRPNQPFFQRVQGRYPISRVQRPRHEADHLPPFITEVKNEWSCISTPHICLHFSYMDNFTFTISDAILIPGSFANTTFPTASTS